MTIKVSLDVNANPAVTCNPGKKVKDHGNDTITWVRASGQEFTFSSLVINGACFSNKNVQSDKITLDDDNKNGNGHGDYPYTLTVMYDGKPYNTKKAGPTLTDSSPMIQNK